jgi:hypothetical protein
MTNLLHDKIEYVNHMNNVVNNVIKYHQFNNPGSNEADELFSKRLKDNNFLPAWSQRVCKSNDDLANFFDLPHHGELNCKVAYSPLPPTCKYPS